MCIKDRNKERKFKLCNDFLHTGSGLYLTIFVLLLKDGVGTVYTLKVFGCAREAYFGYQADHLRINEVQICGFELGFLLSLKSFSSSPYDQTK